MKIRKSKISDAKGIANVLYQSYNIRNANEGAEVFKIETKKGHNYIVAEESGKILGIITWVMHGLPKHQLAELDRVAVLPEFRGKGVSQKLFDFMIKDIKNFYKSHRFSLRKLYILTHADNVRAHRFYEKLGFRHETTLKEHYYKGRDEWVYSRFYG